MGNRTVTIQVKRFIFRSGGVSHWAVTTDDAVIVERDFLHPELDFAGFHLNAGFV